MVEGHRKGRAFRGPPEFADFHGRRRRTWLQVSPAPGQSIGRFHAVAFGDNIVDPRARARYIDDPGRPMTTHRIRLLGIVAAVALPAAAHAGKFGGFSSNGEKYLDGDARVCAPLPATDAGLAAGAPTCERVADKRVLVEYGFRKPKPGGGAPDGWTFAVAAEGKTIKLTASKDGAQRVIASWEASDEVQALGELYVSADGGLAAVDYTAKTLRGALPQTVAIDVRRSFAAAKTAATPDKPAAGKPADDKPRGNAWDRALKHGGTWEQSLIACEQARVTLKLKKDGTFTIRIETRCQGDKWVTNLDGKWVSEGEDDVALTFSNDDGTVEAMPCRFTVDPDSGEDAISCQQEDVVFTMKPAKR
jgi:hypothetical protein